MAEPSEPETLPWSEYQGGADNATEPQAPSQDDDGSAGDDEHPVEKNHENKDEALGDVAISVPDVSHEAPEAVAEPAVEAVDALPLSAPLVLSASPDEATAENTSNPDSIPAEFTSIDNDIVTNATIQASFAENNVVSPPERPLEQPPRMSMDQQQFEPADAEEPTEAERTDTVQALSIPHMEHAEEVAHLSPLPVGASIGAEPEHAHGSNTATTEQAIQDMALLEERLRLEAKAREELEDMLLRIEKHFKAEQAARKKAEELLQAALNSEFELRCQWEEVTRRKKEEEQALEHEREEVRRERRALEGMRQDFEAELAAARAEVARAQDALHATEERVRTAEEVERGKLEAQYQQRLQALSLQMEQVREEMNQRTSAMSQETERWRQQAAMSAAAVMDAKNDVLERRRELDLTKEKMDRLVDKLYMGREGALVAMAPTLPGTHGGHSRRVASMPGNSNNGQYGSTPGQYGPAAGAQFGMPMWTQVAQQPQLPSNTAKQTAVPKLPAVTSHSANSSPQNSRINSHAQEVPPTKPTKPVGRQKSKPDRFDDGKKESVASAMSKWF